MRAKSDVSSSWDYEAYAAIPDDGRRHEIIAGEHYVNPAPNLYHQEVSRLLQYQLITQIELTGLGKVIDAPVDVQLSDRDIVQPDLVVVTSARQQILTPSKVMGIPDMVVEIISPSNANYDLVTKRELYRRCGVPEYWIVFPDEHKILQLVLDEHGRYLDHVETKAITMAMPPQVTVELSKVWRETR